ncbi:DUF2283 domain-containing protein [Exiguobacterium sp. s168]|uniref:DUF2283 domain-containing protein n=1 Tax=Exiguobacterium sp. s168 TaxID=2751194 RepID=UPI001BEAE96E|nr:DUF2283 domain-containing protein [Exiguobacterium sp. s168]
MTIRMTYDQKAKMGYLYLFPETFTPAIEETDELEENEFLNVDVYQEGRIVGIEFFNEEANVIRAVHSQAFLYAEHTDRFSLRLQNTIPKSSCHLQGVAFYFAETDHTGFIGLDILDLERYPVDVLRTLAQPAYK